MEIKKLNIYLNKKFLIIPLFIIILFFFAIKRRKDFLFIINLTQIAIFIIFYLFFELCKFNHFNSLCFILSFILCIVIFFIVILFQFLYYPDLQYEWEDLKKFSVGPVEYKKIQLIWKGLKHLKDLLYTGKTKVYRDPLITFTVNTKLITDEYLKNIGKWLCFFYCSTTSSDIKFYIWLYPEFFLIIFYIFFMAPKFGISVLTPFCITLFLFFYKIHIIYEKAEDVFNFINELKIHNYTNIEEIRLNERLMTAIDEFVHMKFIYRIGTVLKVIFPNV